MPYISKQQRYVTVFMQQIQAGLANPSTNDTISAMLGFASNEVGRLSGPSGKLHTLAPILGLAGLAAAPASMGISLAVAGVAVTVLQIADAGYHFIQKQRGIEEAKFVPDAADIDTAKLALEILFGEVASTLAIQYQHPIERIITDKGVNDLATFAATEVMKQWLNLTQNKQTISAHALIESLTEPARVVKSTIEVMPVYKNAAHSFYAKGFYALPRVVFFDIENEAWSAYERQETQARYGCRAVDTEPLPSLFQPSKTAPDWGDISSNITAVYLIDESSISIVKDYLKRVRAKRFTKSFNEYIGERYGAAFIAVCHDNALSQMDLRYGNFSEVDFRRADLRGCRLENTQWHRAHLECAHFGGVSAISLLKTKWNEAHLEGSQWENVDFSGAQMLQTNLRGAAFTRCQLVNIQQVGCIWDGAQWIDMAEPDDSFTAALTAEREARLDLENTVDKINDTLNTQIQRWLNLEERVALEETKWTALDTRLEKQQQIIEELQQAQDGANIQLYDLNQDIAFIKNCLNAASNAKAKERAEIRRWLDENRARRTEEKVFQQEIDDKMLDIQTQLSGLKLSVAQVQQTVAAQGEKIGALENRIAEVEPQWPNPEKLVDSGKPEELYAILADYHRAFENPRLQNTLEFYIEPNALAFKGAENLHPLREDLEQFEKGNHSILLIHGEVGAGKSSMARLYQKKLWEEWSDASCFVPLLIELKQATSGNPNFLKEHLKSAYGYTDKQIDVLRQRYHFFMILDGLDECPTAQMRHIMEDCELHLWKAKVLVTARTEWMTATRNYRSILTTSQTNILERYVAPFSPMQIDDYLEKKFRNTARDWTEYRDFLNQSKALAQMMVSPVMLHILCDVLPNLMKEAEQGQSTDYTRFGLYDSFLKSWFEREIAKGHDKRSLKTQSDETLMAGFLYYTQALAFTMLCESTLYVKKTYQAAKLKTLGHASAMVKKDVWSDFFDNPDNLLAQRSCPLSIDRWDDKDDGQRYHAYQFIHKSFMEHAAATWLWDALRHPDGTLDTRLSNWNHCFIREERGILTFLAERLTRSPTRTQEEACLLEMVLASRGHPEWAKAASTAMTLLNASHFNFNTRIPNRDLSNIQIPYADLTQGLLAFIDLSGADLSYGNFYEAVLVGANLSNADLTGARFLAGDSFILSNGKVDTIILPPNRPDVVIYAINSEIVIARLSDGVVEKRLTGHTGYITNLAFSQDNKLASGSQDKTIRIWDITLENPHLKTLEGHTHWISALSFSQNNKLASGSNDGTIRIWDMTLENPHLKTFGKDTSSITSLAFDQDNKLASGSFGKTILIWDITLENPYLKTLEGHTSYISSLTFSQDNKLASGSNDHTIRIWDIRLENPHLKTLKGHTNLITSLAFSQDNKLASGSHDKTLCIWDITLENPHLKTLKGHEHWVTSLAFNQDNKLVSSGGYDYTIRTWDVMLENPYFKTLEGHTGSVTSLAFSQNSKLASGSFDHTIRIWDIALENPHLKTLEGHAGEVTSLAFNKDNTLASGSMDRTIRIWDITLENPHLKTFIGHTGFVYSLAFNQDNKLASGSYDNTIRIWDITLENPHLKTLEGHTEQVASLAFNKNNKLASGSNDHTIRIWDITLENPYLKTLKGHTSWITSLAFSQDNKLASGGWDHTIRIWDITLENPCLKILRGHEDEIISLLFTPDNRWLISGSNEKILIWNAQNWEEPPYCLPFSSRLFSLRGNLLVIHHANGVHTIDLGDFPRVLPHIFRWIMAAPPELWLQNCNTANAKGIGFSTKKLLEKKGAIDNPTLMHNTSVAIPAFATNSHGLFGGNVAGSGIAAAKALKASPRVNDLS